MTKKVLIFLVMVVIVSAGCTLGGGDTGQSSNDAAAVQQYFPTISGYNASPVNDIIQAISTVTGGASLATGNLLGAAAVAQLTSMADCYRGVGAMDARIYTQITVPPVIGALAIINQDRLAENFLSCAVGASPFNAPTEPQPCIGSGTFSQNDDTYIYIYAASDQRLCDSFVSHFRQYGG